MKTLSMQQRHQRFASTSNFNFSSPEKEQTYAESIFRHISTSDGQIQEAYLPYLDQLCIDQDDLVEKKLQDFKEDKTGMHANTNSGFNSTSNHAKSVLQVRYEWYKQKRIEKLIKLGQIIKNFKNTDSSYNMKAPQMRNQTVYASQSAVFQPQKKQQIASTWKQDILTSGSPSPRKMDKNPSLNYASKSQPRTVEPSPMNKLRGQRMETTKKISFQNIGVISMNQTSVKRRESTQGFGNSGGLTSTNLQQKNDYSSTFGGGGGGASQSMFLTQVDTSNRNNKLRHHSTSGKLNQTQNHGMQNSPREAQTSKETNFMIDDLLGNEIQKEKLKLQRFIQTKEKSKQILLDRERKIEEKSKKREQQLMKYEKEKIKKTKERLDSINAIRARGREVLQKREQSRENWYNRVDQEYRSQMKEIEQRKNQEEQKLLVLSDKDYKQRRTLAQKNAQQAQQQKQIEDQEIQVTLHEMDSKIVESNQRSEQKINKIKLACSEHADKIRLKNEMLKTREETEELDRGRLFIESFSKKEKAFQKVEKSKKSLISNLKGCNQAREAIKEAQIIQEKRDGERKQKEMNNRLEKVEQRVRENSEERRKAASIRIEVGRLMQEDAYKRKEIYKRNLLMKKIQVAEKHAKIDQVKSRIQQGQFQLQECSRIANEIRIQTQQERLQQNLSHTHRSGNSKKTKNDQK